ncbi:MAG: NAD(P)H-hydrate epimerase, partial [Nanoarchaeota archaeon]
MISAGEMKQLEEICGIPRAMLMENAGKGVAEVLKQKLDVKNKRVLVVAYHGSNGGDGFVAARHLCDDAEVDVLFVGDEGKLKGETLANFKKVESNEKLQILDLEAVDFSDYDIIVDAILGTGVEGEIKDTLATLIRNLGKSK